MRDLQLTAIPAGRDGINRSKNLELLRPSHLAYADGISTERDVFEKIPGASKINTVALTGDVLGHWDFIFGSPGTQELVAYHDDGATAKLVTVVTGGVDKTLNAALTTGGFPWFVEGWTGSQKALYLFNRLNAVQEYLGGATSSAITKPAGDWAANPPAAGASSRDRMVAWGNTNFPHNLYLSIPGVHNDFSGPESAVERMYPGEGDKITAGKFWRDKFYVGKSPQGLYYLDDTDPSIANWERARVTTSIGTGGPGCMLDLDDDLLILGTDGFFYAISQIRTLGQIEVPPFLPIETAQFLKEKLNLAALDKVRSVWFGHKRQAWFAVPTGASAFCNAIIILDLHEAGNPKFLYSSRDVCPALTMRRGSLTAVRKPSFGDNDGFIWQGDQTARNKDGNGYTAQYETVPVAVVPGAVHRANLEELQVVMQPLGNWDLTMEVQRDGEVSQTLAFSMQTPGAAVGSLSLDDDVIAGQTIANVRHRLEGDCHYIKLIGHNDNDDENFAVMSHLVRWTPGNESP